MGCVFVTITLLGCEKKTAEPNTPIVSEQAVSTDHFLETQDLKIRYKSEGKSDEQTLLLLHGFTSSLESWDSLVEHLGNNYHIVRVDLAGHGLTGPDPKSRYSHADNVAFVKAVIDGLHIKNPIIIGNSMGGNIGWHYAAQYPEDVNGLVLIDASGFSLNGLSDEPIELSPMLESYFLKPSKFAVNYGLKNQYADASKIPEGRAEKILEMMQGNGQAYAEMFKVFTLPDPREQLAKITAPTLIVWGEKDAVVPPAHAKLFGDAIVGSKMQIIENSGHVPHEEAPIVTADTIIRFLKEK